MIKINNIIFLSNAYGGTATYQAQILDYLPKTKKNTITFIDSNPSNTLNKTYKNLNNSYLKIFNLDPFNKQKVIGLIKKIQKKSNRNIIIINNPIFLLIYFFFFLKNKKNFSIFLIMHSVIFTFSIKNLILNFLYLFTFFIPDKIFFVSKFTKQWWIKFSLGLNKSINQGKVILHGIRLKKNILALKKKKSQLFKVGYVGRLEHEKNPYLFLELAKESNKNNLNFDFHVFGDGILKKTLQNETQGLIKFYGWQNIEKIMSKIDILVVTSKIETLSFVSLEAKSAGIPTLYCGRGGIDEVSFLNYDSLKVIANAKSLLEGLVKIRNNYNFFTSNCIKTRNLFLAEDSSKKFWSAIKLN